MSRRFGFPKNERLKSRKQIDELFAKGRAFSVFPIRVVYQLEAVAATPGLQVGVSASKKYFKKAVDRNRVKRLLREAYRLQKEALLNDVKAGNKSGNVFFIYVDKTLPEFEAVKTAMGKCLQKLNKLVQSEAAS